MTIEFRALNNGITNLAGSGLGFYSSTFGASVNVGSYNDATYITDSTGTINGTQVHNIKYTHPSSGSINSLTSVANLNIPNQLATLQIRFTNATTVRTQNAKLRIFDRSNINNNPSGVTCKVLEIIHPSTVQTGSTGSGSSTWNTLGGSGTVLTCMTSPGLSGLSPSGSSTTSVQHDWHFAISPSPDSIGSKLFGLYFEVEYL